MVQEIQHFDVEPLPVRADLRQAIAEAGARALAVADREVASLRLPSSVVAVLRARGREH